MKSAFPILAILLLVSAQSFASEQCSDSEGNTVKATLSKKSNGDYKIGGPAKVKSENFEIVDISSDGGGSLNVKLQSKRTGLVTILTCGQDVVD